MDLAASWCWINGATLPLPLGFPESNVLLTKQLFHEKPFPTLNAGQNAQYQAIFRNKLNLQNHAVILDMNDKKNEKDWRRTSTNEKEGISKS